MIDTTIRDPRSDVDRVLLAAQLTAEGERRAARIALTSAGIWITNAVEADVDRMALLLTERDDLTRRIQLLTDDPDEYVHQYEEHRPAVTLTEYREHELDDLAEDSRQLLADLRVRAETIAALAEPDVAA